MPQIFKIIDEASYGRAQAEGAFHGVEIDLRDGYIHFSAGDQVAETARLHFAGRENLMLLAVDADALGDTLKWEASRGGKLFPHLYGPLAMIHVLWAKPLPWDGSNHEFPAEAFA